MQRRQRPGTTNRLAFPACLPLGFLLADSQSIFNPASRSAQSINSLFILALVISFVILALVWGPLLYCILRFRRRDSEHEPPQLYGSQPIEVAWTAAPGLIVFVLALVLTRTTNEIERTTADAPDNALVVTAIGHQWWWEYVIERNGDDEMQLIVANELHVPAGRPVYFNLQSADVNHCYWLPRLSGKTDCIPGRTNYLWFETDKTGLYIGQCAEYCGTQHAHMLLNVYVDSPDDFEAWLANQRKTAVEDAKVAKGRAVFMKNSCVNCHTIRGTRAKGTFAPDLTHLASRQTIASGMVQTPSDDPALARENLLRWITDPQQVKPGCLMPAFGLSQREFESIVDYLVTLK